MAMTNAERQAKWREHKKKKELIQDRAREKNAREVIKGLEQEIEKLKRQNDVMGKQAWLRGILDTLFHIHKPSQIALILNTFYLTRDICLEASKHYFSWCVYGSDVDVFQHLDRPEVFTDDGLPKIL